MFIVSGNFSKFKICINLHNHLHKLLTVVMSAYLPMQSTILISTKRDHGFNIEGVPILFSSFLVYSSAMQ